VPSQQQLQPKDSTTTGAVASSKGPPAAKPSVPCSTSSPRVMERHGSAGSMELQASQAGPGDSRLSSQARPLLPGQQRKEVTSSPRSGAHISPLDKLQNMLDRGHSNWGATGTGTLASRDSGAMPAVCSTGGAASMSPSAKQNGSSAGRGQPAA
jgi:hypothetical protein